MPTTTTARTYTPRPFVYQGRRWDRTQRKLYDVVQPLEQSHDYHGEPMMFECKSKGRRSMVLGGIYTGAEFDDSGARGMNVAKYTGRWPDDNDRIEWSALDGQADASYENDRLERDDKRTNEIEALLLPLRKAMHRNDVKFDPAKQQAIINAVTRALRVPPRANEE